ncbi:MAG: hypothetical protein EAY75_05735 [Bacteroidetes bacterium]|nr:MAG: hypothetical protein EAY75_05735 [Bacteroidota bacterium]
MTVQAPVPIVGALPAKVAVVPQTFWVTPATEVVGVPFLVMLTVLVEAVQGAFVIDHWNTYTPLPVIPLTVAVGKLMLLNVTAVGPLTKLHSPVPTAGTLPFNV